MLLILQIAAGYILGRFGMAFIDGFIAGAKDALKGEREDQK